MSAAAYSPPADRTSDWLEELERILKEFDALPNHAQDAVSSVVNSLLHDPDTSDSEITHLNALIARHRPRSDEGRQHRRPSLSKKRTQYAHRIALTLSQSG
ncbi:MAG: hypothetical protein ACXVH1_26945 [Solirubrobacteraceae bacterium]